MPRSRVCRNTAPRGSRPSGQAMSKRIGPSMSTEPGWMTAVRACPFLLGATTGHGRKTIPACC